MAVVSLIRKNYLTHNFSRWTQYNCHSLGNSYASKVQKQSG